MFSMRNLGNLCLIFKYVPTFIYDDTKTDERDGYKKSIGMSFLYET